MTKSPDFGCICFTGTTQTTAPGSWMMVSTKLWVSRVGLDSDHCLTLSCLDIIHLGIAAIQQQLLLHSPVSLVYRASV